MTGSSSSGATSAPGHLTSTRSETIKVYLTQYRNGQEKPAGVRVWFLLPKLWVYPRFRHAPELSVDFSPKPIEFNITHNSTKVDRSDCTMIGLEVARVLFGDIVDKLTDENMIECLLKSTRVKKVRTIDTREKKWPGG